jgi:hypothetical protein
MTQPEIKDKLQLRHKQLTELVLSLNDEDFLYSSNGKWTAGQQLDHIYRSVAAVNMGLAIPKFILMLVIGKANRPSREYNVLIDKYSLKLQQGGRAVGRFVPKPVLPSDKTKLAQKLLKTVDSLCKKTGNYTENQLDFYILPHPLLGKLTVREMLYFTIHHALHHQQLVLRNLGRAAIVEQV